MQLTTLLLTTAAMASTALANIQVNYYSDNGCNNYLAEVDVTWASVENNCYNFQYGTSANVAWCSDPNCVCTFYGNRGCTGNAVASWYSNGGSNCLADIHQYQSFDCYYN